LSALGSKDSAECLAGLKLAYETMIKMNGKRKVMWSASDMVRYTPYRIFLMGITGNEKIFDDGILYSGVDTQKRKYRGETGAQDDIIPTMDIFTGVTEYYPDTVLTKYLEDLRQYRPKPMIAFFQDLEREAKGLNDRVAELTGAAGLVYLLSIVDQIYAFRNGHWQFVQKYIMRNTTYLVATGGTPLNLWLPNQIRACLDKMDAIFAKIPHDGTADLPADLSTMYGTLKAEQDNKKSLLASQMKLLSGTYNIEEVIKLDNTQN